MPLTSSRTEIKRPPQQHTNKISKLKYFNFREENRDTRFRKVIRFPNIFRIFYNWIFGNMIILRENWKKKRLSTFICSNKIFDIFDHFGHVLPFCNGKNRKLKFKNIKKIWKPLKTHYLYV